MRSAPGAWGSGIGRSAGSRGEMRACADVHLHPGPEEPRGSRKGEFLHFGFARVVRLTDDGSVPYRTEQDHCHRFPAAASADL